MTNKQKSLLTLFILLVLIFGIPYLWRSYRDNDIKSHSKFTFAKIFKKTGSLKNGSHWHYSFTYEGQPYFGHWSTHVDYDVNIGEYFLVNFSSKNPDHNKIFYNCKLKVNPTSIKDSAWDVPPARYIKSGLKSKQVLQIR
jgi:hypothetical protein